MSNTLKTIVIGTSLSDTSDDVVNMGSAIARATGATPWLLCVQPTPAYPVEMLGTPNDEWFEAYAQTLREKLARQAQRTSLASLPGFDPTRLHSAMGATSDEIVALARKVRADLIVIGASENGALHRALLGSTADGVIRKAPCPVLVVRSATCVPPVRVEIPVDLSPVSEEALRRGMNFLHEVGANLADKEVLFVLNPLEVAGSLQFTEDQIERFALDELRRFLQKNGINRGLARVRTGYPAKEILAALEERETDLVILGTHGRQGIERMMMGSVALAVMHRAACNLLIIPPEVRPQAGAERNAEVGADWTFVSDEVPETAASHGPKVTAAS